MTVRSELEEPDIQKLIFHGYAKHEHASFRLLRIGRVATAQKWLKGLEVTTGSARLAEDEVAVHVAFSAAGLKKLGLDDEILGGFSLPFREGMESRAQVLGDVGRNATAGWDWGSNDERSGDQRPHIALLVYAAESRLAAERSDGEVGKSGCTELHRLPDPTVLRVGDRKPIKEHFGFDDGIGNPVMRRHYSGKDLPATAPVEGLPHNQVAPGEFLLGYPNQAGLISASPHVPPGSVSGSVLPNGDLGRNGSYLVFRQLEQDVQGFWNHIWQRAGADHAGNLAAKMVGRWPNGAPLAIWAQQPADTQDPRKNDDFLYAGDPKGYGCPLGAHVRRSNPRDAVPLLAAGPSVIASKQRRILRRGRSYGKPVTEGWPDPEAIVSNSPKEGPRGLHFLCFAADLERQYEFLQQTWINSRKFGGLANDPDPLLANPAIPELGPRSTPKFTVQHDPINRRIELEQFVTARGGAYFFLPGRKALKYLASLR